MNHSPILNSPISTDARVVLIDLLNQILAGTIDLKSHIQFAHWNVKSQQFYALHQLFDQLAQALDSPIDRVAERIATLGGIAQGTVHSVARQSILSSIQNAFKSDQDLIHHLAHNYSEIDPLIRQTIEFAHQSKDVGTEDLLADLLGQFEKDTWILRSHLI